MFYRFKKRLLILVLCIFQGSFLSQLLYASTISPIQDTKSPFDATKNLVSTANTPLTLLPILEIPVEHQGKEAELYALALVNNVLYIKDSVSWEYFDDQIPSINSVTLGDKQDFDLFNGDLSVYQLQVFYGYRLLEDPYSFYGNSFKVTISEVARQLQEMLDNAIKPSAEIKEGIPGAVLALTIPGEGEWVGTAGYADVANQIPMESDHRMRAGSITKTFTGMLILQLAEEGKLSLDDSVDKWLPGMVEDTVDTPMSGKDITIRQLLNHTSGLSNFVFDMNWTMDYYNEPTKQYTPEELVNMTLAMPDGTFPDGTKYTVPLSQPGAKWNYSNTGYILLGLIAEKVTGNTWESEIENRFIKPLGLTNTYVPKIGEPEIQGKHATGYWNLFDETEHEPGFEDKLVERTLIDSSFTWASGDMISTAEDLARWVTAIGEKDLLKFDIEEQQFTWFPVAPMVKMGLGITKELLYATYAHRGQIGGFDAVMHYEIDLKVPVTTMINRSLTSVTPYNVSLVITYNALDIIKNLPMGTTMTRSRHAR